MITIGQLLDFVLEHRTDKTFKGYTKEEVAAALVEGIQEGTLFYAIDSREKITAMLLWTKIESQKVLFVLENLSMSLRQLKLFAMEGQRRFPGWKIEALRHGKHRKFNTEKLYKKLTI